MSKRGMQSADLLRFVFVGDPQISPDGDLVLFGRKTIEKNKYVTQLVTVDDHGVLRQWTNGESGASHGRWSADGSQIAFIAKRSGPAAQIHVLSTDGGEARAVTKVPEGSLGGFKWSPDGKYIAYTFREALDADKEANKKKRAEEGLSEPPLEVSAYWFRLDGDGYFGDRRFALYVIEVATGKLVIDGFAPANDGEYGYDWHPTEPKLVVSYSTARDPNVGPSEDKLFILGLDGSATELTAVPKGSKGNPLWSPCGKFISYAGDDNEEDRWSAKNTRIFLVDASTGATKDLMGHQKEYDLSANTLSDTAEASFGAHYIWSPDGTGLLAQIGYHGETQIAFVSVDAEVKMLTEGKHTLKMGSVSKDGRRIAATLNDPLHLPEIAWVERELGTGKLVPKVLTHLNHAIEEEIELVAPEELWIDSTDGTKVHGWVMRPKGEGPHPAALNIHGGPHAQYGWAFFHEFQVFVSAGYVVMYTNPRGSKGYGEAHTEAIKGAWGTKDWDDIQAATAWLKADPGVDSAKLGVMGGSYGGYMTNWVIGHTNDFACAISDRCVSNMVSQWSNSDYPSTPNMYFPGRSDGDLNDIAKLWEQSPIAYFKNAITPTLVIHSVGDLRCNVEQSDQVFHSLQVRGIPSRYVRYPASTFHGLSRSGPPDLRQHRQAEYLAWMKKWLG